MTDSKIFPLGPHLEAGDTGVEIVESRTVHKGWLRIDDVKVRARRFDGTISEPHTREIIINRGEGVVVLPYDPIRDVVVLIEQLRVAAYLSKRTNGWTLEPVAGLIEEGHTPEDTARREAEEECGREIKRLIKVGHYMSSPGAYREVMHLFIGEVTAGKGGEIGGLASEQEDIRSHVLSLDDAIALADADKIDNANALLAINWLARHREKIRAEWLKA